MSIGGVSLPLKSELMRTSLSASIEPWRISASAACSLSNLRTTSPDLSESELCAEKKLLCGDPSALPDFPVPPSICDNGELTVMVSVAMNPPRRDL
jgi:hypothetical protein